MCVCLFIWYVCVCLCVTVPHLVTAGSAYKVLQILCIHHMGKYSVHG